MNVFIQAYLYATSHLNDLLSALRGHLLLVAIPLGISLLVGLPLGLFSARSKAASTLLINSFSALRVIPSLAILFLAIAYFGLSFQSAAIALTI
ncbi:MAG: hypothetical protein JOZ78_07920, partial [Chroococcidiopsidaceae cyanobacterium CP_BM_ER_R8_30]|nr:hypothetical protein [Chroococcidiopsidaceae cyanobacterium CP_BM_ER_R8_30]